MAWIPKKELINLQNKAAMLDEFMTRELPDDCTGYINKYDFEKMILITREWSKRLENLILEHKGFRMVVDYHTEAASVKIKCYPRDECKSGCNSQAENSGL